jgi:2-amino-4-hydroxy-6-hydroxymethyldihydropteridine diphosphokinase
MKTVSAFIGIGANLGNAQANVRLAIARLDRLPGTRVTASSSLFCSAPVDADGDDYVNAVARVETSLAAGELLEQLLKLEQDFGRQRSYRNAPRLLDLDILLYGKETISCEISDNAGGNPLTVPHPRLTERAFALLPLLQIDALIDIPGKGPAHSFAPGVAGQRIQKIQEE